MNITPPERAGEQGSGGAGEKKKIPLCQMV